MTSEQSQRLKEMQERLRLHLLNRLTYPKTLLGIAKEHVLSDEEIRKAYECLEACPRIVDAELTLFLLSMQVASEHGA